MRLARAEMAAAMGTMMLRRLYQRACQQRSVRCQGVRQCQSSCICRRWFRLFLLIGCPLVGELFGAAAQGQALIIVEVLPEFGDGDQVGVGRLDAEDFGDFWAEFFDQDEVVFV